MARSVFPDEGSRLVFRLSGANKPLLSAAGGTATVYADELGVSLANIQAIGGGAIVGSQLRVSDASQMPLFLGPDGVDTVWVSVDGGPTSPCYARSDDRLDALVSEVDAIVAVKTVNGINPDGSGNITISPGAVADATTSAKGIVQLAGDLAGTADAPTVPGAVKTTGAQVVAGVKTFTDKPTVPDATFTIAKTTGLQDAIDLKADLLLALSTKTSSYTLVLADGGSLVQMDSASANTVTIPANATAALPVGTVIGVAQVGTGLTTVSPASGVTLTWNNGSPGTGAKAMAGQHSELTLVKTGTDAWRMTGALAA